MTVPAILVLVGVATTLFGLAPRFALVTWAVLAVAVLVDLFGELLRFPAWTRRLSPLEHVPGVPAEALATVPLVVLGALAAMFVAVGLRALDARDLRAQ